MPAANVSAYAPAALLGTRIASSVGSARSCQSTSGPYGFASRLRNHRDLALFDLAVDSKLRVRLEKLQLPDIQASSQANERASIIQSKTQRTVRFEINKRIRKAPARWMEEPPDGQLGAPLARAVP